MTFIALSDYVGISEPLNPASVAFVEKPSNSCRSCIFNGQRSSVCRAAGLEAAKRGIKDCDDGVVYKLPKRDPRQLPIEEV